jgi:glycosyltransferase involved in cell wall biosynthesis
MIVKNEEKHLARCLWSVKPVVDEMIIVDTGSADQSREIAISFGAKLYEFPWGDDFADARNFSLSKASGDWIFVLDADEVVSHQDHDGFRALVLSAGTSGGCAFQIQTRNYTHHSNTIGWRSNAGEYAEEEGSGWFPSEKVRLFRSDPRIRFINPVHELVEPSLQELHVPVRCCRIPVHHFGKLHEAKTHEKTKTYRDLGRKKLKKSRRSLAALRELAIQSSHLGRHEESTKLWREYLKREPQSAEAYVNLGTAYWNRGRFREAIDCARRASRLNPSMKEARFNLAVALLMAGRAGESRPILLQLLEEHPDYSAARFMLCVACACLGDTQRVEAEMPKMKATPLGPFLSESFLDVAKRFHSSSQPDCARLTLEAAVRHDFASAEVIALLENVRTAA